MTSEYVLSMALQQLAKRVEKLEKDLEQLRSNQNNKAKY